MGDLSIDYEAGPNVLRVYAYDEDADLWGAFRVPVGVMWTPRADAAYADQVDAVVAHVVEMRTVEGDLPIERVRAELPSATDLAETWLRIGGMRRTIESAEDARACAMEW